MRVASLCRYWQKRKTGRQKQSSHDFARPWFHMSRQCAEEDLFHSCFPLYFGFPFRVMFVICHLFPEIREEVPENFQEDWDFLTCAGESYAEASCDVRTRVMPLWRECL